MVIPWWGQLLISILNLILSNGAAALAVYAQTGNESAALSAGAISLVNHVRNQPSLLTLTKGPS